MISVVAVSQGICPGKEQLWHCRRFAGHVPLLSAYSLVHGRITCTAHLFTLWMSVNCTSKVMDGATYRQKVPLCKELSVLVHRTLIIRKWVVVDWNYKKVFWNLNRQVILWPNLFVFDMFWIISTPACFPPLGTVWDQYELYRKKIYSFSPTTLSF